MRVNYKGYTGGVLYDMDTDEYRIELTGIGLMKSTDPVLPTITTDARGGTNPVWPLYEKFKKAVDKLISEQSTRETSDAKG